MKTIGNTPQCQEAHSPLAEHTSVIMTATRQHNTHSYYNETIHDGKHPKTHSNSSEYNTKQHHGNQLIVPNNIPDYTTKSIEENQLPSNLHIVNNIEIHPTPTLFSTNSPPARSTPLFNPERGDCHRSKIPKSLRYLIQNANGLQAHSQSKFEGTLDRIFQLQADVIGLVETSVNWGHMETTQRFKNTIHRKTPGGSLTLSPIPTNYSNAYLPGGTLTLTVGRWRSFIDSAITDSGGMGRWTGNSYRVHNNHKLPIISAYRVCDSTAQVD